MLNVDGWKRLGSKKKKKCHTESAMSHNRDFLAIAQNKKYENNTEFGDISYVRTTFKTYILVNISVMFQELLWITQPLAGNLKSLLGNILNSETNTK